MKTSILALAAVGAILAGAAAPARQCFGAEAVAPSMRPDLTALSARLGAGAIPPTAEQIEEQRRMVGERVERAIALLDSRDTAKKIIGVEQLAAYPTREAEQRLALALAEEDAAEVRAGAARALVYVMEPDRQGISALLKAVADRRAEVRATALQTLAAYLNRLDRGSIRFRQIVEGAKQLAQCGRLDKDTRGMLGELVAGFPE